MIRRDNNPRAFAETVSITAWRSAYDKRSGTADLFIDVVFAEGRIGEEGSSPVRFRLKLKKAEVHVVGDALGVLTFPAKSVARAAIESIKVSKKKTIAEASERNSSAKLQFAKPQGEVGAASKRSRSIGQEVSTEFETTPMKFLHRKTDYGYAWTIFPAQDGSLLGQPWESSERRLIVRDSEIKKRKLGEPPEPRIELRCRREDLQITDIQFKKRTTAFWASLSRGKQLAVEQYLKDELIRLGFECGDLSDPFAQVVLADVVPEGG